MNQRSLLNGGNRMPGRPIQLISQENGKFKIESKAVDILKSCKGSIAICCVVGPYRTGKSYILNLLLNRPEGFDLGPELESCTRGIWMWDTPIKHKNKHGEFNLILLDTEGLESFDTTPELDNMIFVLCLLLSSLFVYNTKNVIDKEAIRKLGIMTNLSKHIDSGAGTIDPNEDDIPTNAADVRDMILNLPDFIWAVRDVFLKNRYGSENDYLEAALQMETRNANDDYIKQVNFIRNAIKSSFKSLKCFLIPTPINGPVGNRSYDETLRYLDQVRLSDLRADFREKINDLCACIVDNIAYKNLLGVPLSAPAFVAYMQRVVEAMNENQQVKIVDSLMASIEYASRKSLEDAKDMYETEMADFLSENPLPLEWKVLQAAHRNAYKEAIKILELNLNGENEYTKEFFDQFNQHICVYEGNDENKNIVDGKYFLLREENSKQIIKFFKDKLNSLWNEIMERNRNNQTENVGVEFANSYNRVLQSYQAEMRFSDSAEKSQAFNEWYQEKDVDRVMENIMGLSEQIKARIRSEHAMNQEIALKEQAIQAREDAIRQWKADIAANEIGLKEIIARHENTIKILQEQLNRPVHRPRRRRRCTIS